MSTTTTQAQKGKPCNRCGKTIIWNNTSHFFESPEYPKFQHCCPLPCNKEGCGGTIYFSNIAPKNEQTGKPIPLDFPVPQIMKTDSSKMEWVVHVHKNNIPADTPPAAPAPEVKVPETKPLDQGQNTLEYKPTPEQSNTGTSVKNPIAQTANPDVNAAILSAINEQNQRLGKLEQYFNDVVPAITKYITMMEAVIPKLNVIAGKIADNSITSASDLVQHNLSEAQEKNLQ
jgi:hypothetical protein